MTAILMGVAAGLLAGMLGVGGGVLFVPALVLAVGLSHVEAEATSLLAVTLVAAVGAWRQHGYGNLRLRDGMILGAWAVPGALGGVVVVNVVPERAVEIAFALLLLWVAFGLVRRSGAGVEPAERGAASP